MAAGGTPTDEIKWIVAPHFLETPTSLEANFDMDYRTRLQNLLRELFQFDSADLDFGIYRILHQRRAEIESFIQSGLLDAVKKEFESLEAVAMEEKQG
mgnify:CR=1 FL=1